MQITFKKQAGVEALGINFFWQLTIEGEAPAGFQVQRELGRGGSSRVFLASEISSGRRVALKLFSGRKTSAMLPARAAARKTRNVTISKLCIRHL